MDARLSRRRSPSRTRRDLTPALLLGVLLGVTLLPVVARAQGAGSDTLTLLWTAPGDDGSVGTAARYEIRMSISPISDANWGSASAIAGPPSPASSGTRQSVVVRGLSRGTTYYFAIKAVDDADNVSGLSNVVRWDWIYDTAPPAAPTGLAAELENGTEARVRWSANAEPDLAGYTVYRSLTPGGPFQAISPAGHTSAEFLDTTIPDGTTGVWYQVSATDVSGNESARSATLAVSLGTQAATVFELQPAYPNPSRGSEPVVIPVNVPTGGTGGAEIRVTDAGGHSIRTLALTGLSGGPQNVIWDGRNDAGNSVAPGVYRAWLTGSSVKDGIKMVRLP